MCGHLHTALDTLLEQLGEHLVVWQTQCSCKQGVVSGLHLQLSLIGHNHVFLSDTV